MAKENGTKTAQNSQKRYYYPIERTAIMLPSEGYRTANQTEKLMKRFSGLDVIDPGMILYVGSAMVFYAKDKEGNLDYNNPKALRYAILSDTKDYPRVRDERKKVVEMAKAGTEEAIKAAIDYGISQVAVAQFHQEKVSVPDPDGKFGNKRIVTETDFWYLVLKDVAASKESIIQEMKSGAKISFRPTMKKVAVEEVSTQERVSGPAVVLQLASSEEVAAAHDAEPEIESAEPEVAESAPSSASA